MTDQKDNKDEVLHCSFCGKSQNEVKKLIAGRTSKVIGFDLDHRNSRRKSMNRQFGFDFKTR